MIDSLKTCLWSNLRDAMRPNTARKHLHVAKISGEKGETVSLFVFERDYPVPTFYVKTVRDPSKAESLGREFEILSRLWRDESYARLRPSLPRPLALVELEGCPALVTSVLPGRPLAQLLGRRICVIGRKHRARNALTGAIEWLIAFQEVGANRESGARLEIPHEVLLDGLPGLPAGHDALRALLPRLASEASGLPPLAVPSHGRFLVGNVLSHQGEIGVVNWADFRELSNPLDDFLDLFLSAGILLSRDGIRQALPCLITSRSWLHRLFLVLLRRYCHAVKLEPENVRGCIFAYARRRLQREISRQDSWAVGEAWQLIDSLFQHEKVLGDLTSPWLA